ncbi:MAG TPA: serine/threonine-protein kinase, partial [Polyangiaceae bacterium]|nr:serine/threonine-protein kinase [Polyangiaceae bacterium]
NYRLERLLGRGRMGVVYLAQDEALLRPTAVKVLSWSLPESQGQSPEAWFISEARNVARVNHPNVVQIYSVARHGPHCYIAMEYVDGATADVWIENSGPFSVEQATELLIQTAGALQAAHDANVVHRDIKPENLMVGSDGVAKLGDFGMALHTAKASSFFNVGRVGTPYYTAPEIWNGDPASPASDIYALGATFFYLLTGQPPYVASELQELATAHRCAEIPEILTRQGTVPSACQDLVRRCLAKSPRQRFPSAQAVGWEARALLRKLASVPPPAPTVPNLVLEETRAPPDPPPTATVAKVNGSYVNDNWSKIMGFAREPFGRCEPGKMPYRGEPHGPLLTLLEGLLRDTDCPTLLLEGAEGSGRTTLAKALVSSYCASGPCAIISCEGIGPPLSLTKKALRAFGASPGLGTNVGHEMDSLVEHCLGAQATQAAPLLVVDDCELTPQSLEELASIALAARLTKSFRLLLLVSPGFDVHWSRGDNLLSKKLTLPALGAADVAAYVDAWMSYSRIPGVPPILLTPDALLLLTHCSLGVVDNVNHILVNMLRSAATRERRVLDSWDTWVGSLESPDGSSNKRPSQWPTPEVLTLLNRCRQQVGIELRR